MSKPRNWNDPLTELPEVTIFSIDPNTGKPYMTHEHAEKLAYMHINRKAKNLLTKLEPDDLKQELMLKLYMSKFDVSLSSAQTFAITCMTSQCARIWEKTFKVRDKHKETSDFEYYTAEDGTARMASEVIGVEYTTPEDHYMAKQTLIQYVEQQESFPEWKKTNQPDGWKGVRPGRWEETKRGNKRKKSLV